MSYGLKLYNTAGKSKILTPDDGTVIAAGPITMSNSLEGDNTYGEDIALGATYDEDEISVLVVPRRPIFGVNQSRFIDGGTLYYNTFYLDSAKTYYTRNTSNGIMTSFSAGNKTVNSELTWNPVLSVFPIAFWDKRGANTFSNVRLFAATGYLCNPQIWTNKSLTGSASGSGGSGSVGNVKDDDENTYYGVNTQSSDSQPTYSVTVSMDAVNINTIEIHHTIRVSRNNAVNTAWVKYYVDIYSNGSWINGVLYEQIGPFAPYTYLSTQTDSISGFWSNVTAIRVRGEGYVYGDGDPYGHVTHFTRELRAWKKNQSENGIVYSIGNQGITPVVPFLV